MLPDLVKTFFIRIESDTSYTGSGDVLYGFEGSDIASMTCPFLGSHLQGPSINIASLTRSPFPSILLHVSRINIELHASATVPRFTQAIADFIKELKKFLVDAKVEQEVTMTLMRYGPDEDMAFMRTEQPAAETRETLNFETFDPAPAHLLWLDRVSRAENNHFGML